MARYIILITSITLAGCNGGPKGKDSEIRNVCLDGVSYWVKEGYRSDAMSVAYQVDGSLVACE